MPLFLLVSWLPPLASGLPVVFVFCPWCCSESEDSVNNSRIQHSNCLWITLTFSPFVLEFTSGTVAVCTCAPCLRASSTSKTDSFLWGHGPDTLACKARPSFDGCGTSLSVSLSFIVIVPMPNAPQLQFSDAAEPPFFLLSVRLWFPADPFPGGFGCGGLQRCGPWLWHIAGMRRQCIVVPREVEDIDNFSISRNSSGTSS